MMLHHIFTADAIVLRRRNVGEADRTLTLFTKQYGKLRVLARGVRKITSKRAPHIEVFTRSIVTIHRGKGVDTVTEVAPVTAYDPVRKDLKRIHAAYYLCELVDGLLPEEQVHEDVYALLVTALETLATVKQERIDILRARFAAAILRLLGFMERGKTMSLDDLDSYIEGLLERRLKTVRLASQVGI